MRVVSLLPSATEIACAVGAAGELVGVSHECDFPPEVRDLPVLTRSRIDVTGSSAEIDAAVRSSMVQDALSIYAVDAELLGRLRPDVVLTQDLCEVCAVSIDDVRAAVARLAHHEDVDVVSLRPIVLADILGDVERVADAVGRAAEGSAVRRGLEARTDAIARRARAARERPRTVTVEWIEPIMLGGTWMPELVERAGGDAVGVTAGGAAPTVDAAALSRLAPEVVVIKPCGFGVERTMEERAVIERTILPALPSDARVYVTDGNAYFNRPGPRIVESLEILAACVHPERFEDFAAAHASAIVRLA